MNMSGIGVCMSGVFMLPCSAHARIRGPELSFSDYKTWDQI